MANWRIEVAKRPGRCAECGYVISAGAHRFGTPTKTRWFHLECAAEGAPRMFAGFAAQAEKLGQPKAKLDGADPLRRHELDSLLQAEGDNALDVLADALEERTDPWAELIRLRRSGHNEEAKAHFERHQRSLLEGLPRGDLRWKDGVIVQAAFRGKAPQLDARITRLAAARTAGRIEHLILEGPVDGSLFGSISRGAPTLRKLTIIGHASGLERLKLPRLEHFQLKPPSSAELASRPGPAAEIDGLARADLPRLQVLRLTTFQPIGIESLERLLNAALIRRLTWFDLEDASPIMRTLDDAGLRYVLSRRHDLEHLRAMSVGLTGRSLTGAELASAKKFFKSRNERAWKLAQASDAQDDSAFDEED